MLFVELLIGFDFEIGIYGFLVVLCLNMNILMFKFMSMLEISGYLFCDCDISVIELY